MDSTLQARRFISPSSPDIPRHWLPDDPATVAVLNTYTVLVPSNEGFYLRTVARSLPGIADPVLRAQGVIFIQQEAEHGVAHKRYWRNLETQGYHFRGFERMVDRWVYRFVEKITPLSLRIAMVSCVEHVNAFIGHEFLSQRILEKAHPEVRALMEWHFAEEIEHKSVSFDVMKTIAPRYIMRLAGFMITVPVFYALMTIGMLRFLLQDGEIWRWSTWRSLWRHLWSTHKMVPRTLSHLINYLRPSFHPSQLNDSALAEAVIARYSGQEYAWLSESKHAKKTVVDTQGDR